MDNAIDQQRFYHSESNEPEIADTDRRRAFFVGNLLLGNRPAYRRNLNARLQDPMPRTTLPTSSRRRVPCACLLSTTP